MPPKGDKHTGHTQSDISYITLLWINGKFRLKKYSVNLWKCACIPLSTQMHVHFHRLTMYPHKAFPQALTILAHKVYMHYLISKCLRRIVNYNSPWQVSAKNGEILDVVPINTHTMLPKQAIPDEQKSPAWRLHTKTNLVPYNNVTKIFSVYMNCHWLLLSAPKISSRVLSSDSNIGYYIITKSPDPIFNTWWDPSHHARDCSSVSCFHKVWCSLKDVSDKLTA
jgi:hypothetical protein